jgi:hypothetical protein
MVLCILPSYTAEAADAELYELQYQLNIVTAQQRQMLKTTGYDVNALCVSIPTDVNHQVNQLQYLAGSNL